MCPRLIQTIYNAARNCETRSGLSPPQSPYHEPTACNPSTLRRKPSAVTCSAMCALATALAVGGT